MADINHTITLGIGTPGDIAHFTLVGLSPSPAAVTGKRSSRYRYQYRYRALASILLCLSIMFSL